MFPWGLHPFGKGFPGLVTHPTRSGPSDGHSAGSGWLIPTRPAPADVAEL